MRLKSVELGLLVVALIVSLTGCRGESEPPPMVSSPTTRPVRTATPLVAAFVTEEGAAALTPTMTSSWTAVPVRTPSPIRMPIARPTVTQTATWALFPSVQELRNELDDIKVTEILTPTPFPRGDLPIGALAFVDRDHQLLFRDATGEVCVLAEGGISSSPAWSPDGTRLAFSYQADDRSPAEVRIYDPAEETQTTAWTDPGELAPLVLPFRKIAWSPSGRYMYLSQGCCVIGALYVLDLESGTLVGRYTSSTALWSPETDLLALSVPQPVERLIPIESGDSSSIVLVRPGEIAPTLILTGTVDRLYSVRAWLSPGELLYAQDDLHQEGEGVRIESSWWVAEIDSGMDGPPSVIASHSLETLPVRYDDEALAERLSLWLPGVTFAERVWSADGVWVVFRAYGDAPGVGWIYAFQWEEERLIGPFAEGFDLALAPVVPSASPTAAGILDQGEELSFEICGESTAWMRPTEQEQSDKWWCSERYSSADEQVVQYSWTHDFFVTYGHGSPTYDIVNLSGLWTLSTDVRAQCLEPQRQDAVLRLQKAELWLLYHRVKQIKRIGSDYVIVVEPSQSGVQFVQFARPEQWCPLTLHFVTEDRQRIERIVEAESVYWPNPQLVPTTQP